MLCNRKVFFLSKRFFCASDDFLRFLQIIFIEILFNMWRTIGICKTTCYDNTDTKRYSPGNRQYF